jgi:hypothetical protein
MRCHCSQLTFFPTERGRVALRHGGGCDARRAVALWKTQDEIKLLSWQRSCRWVDVQGRLPEQIAVLRKTRRMATIGGRLWECPQKCSQTRIRREAWTPIRALVTMNAHRLLRAGARTMPWYQIFQICANSKRSAETEAVGHSQSPWLGRRSRTSPVGSRRQHGRFLGVPPCWLWFHFYMRGPASFKTSMFMCTVCSSGIAELDRQKLSTLRASGLSVQYLCDCTEIDPNDREFSAWRQSGE